MIISSFCHFNEHSCSTHLVENTVGTERRAGVRDWSEEFSYRKGLCPSTAQTLLTHLALSSPLCSQTHRMGQAGGDHCSSSGPTSLLKHMAQDCVQRVLEDLQWGRLHSLSRQSVQCSVTAQENKFFLMFRWNFWASVPAHSSCPTAGHHQLLSGSPFLYSTKPPTHGRVWNQTTPPGRQKLWSSYLYFPCVFCRPLTRSIAKLVIPNRYEKIQLIHKRGLAVGVLFFPNHIYCIQLFSETQKHKQCRTLI